MGVAQSARVGNNRRPVACMRFNVDKSVRSDERWREFILRKGGLAGCYTGFSQGARVTGWADGEIARTTPRETEEQRRWVGRVQGDERAIC